MTRNASPSHQRHGPGAPLDQPPRHGQPEAAEPAGDQIGGVFAERDRFVTVADDSVRRLAQRYDDFANVFALLQTAERIADLVDGKHLMHQRRQATRLKLAGQFT